MKNNLEYGIDWNIYENLKEFKAGNQSIHQTSKNIRNLFAEIKLIESERRSLCLIAEQERNAKKLLTELKQQ